MTRVVLAVLLALALTGCAVVTPRQTLAVLDDGVVVFAEGRKDVCIAAEDADGTRLGEVCDVVIDPRGVGEAALLALDDTVVVVAVVPLDVVEVRVEVPGEGIEERLERIESDITTGFAVGELDPGLGTVELVGVDASGGLVGRSAPIDLPTSGTAAAHVPSVDSP